MGNKVQLYVSKLSYGNKKESNTLKKAVNNAKIEITIYPDNLSGGGYSIKKFKQKSNGQHILKIRNNSRKKTYTLKNGKSDGWGGTVQLTPSRNGVTVSNCNIFTGTIE